MDEVVGFIISCSLIVCGSLVIDFLFLNLPQLGLENTLEDLLEVVCNLALKILNRKAGGFLDSEGDEVGQSFCLLTNPDGNGGLKLENFRGDSRDFLIEARSLLHIVKDHGGVEFINITLGDSVDSNVVLSLIIVAQLLQLRSEQLCILLDFLRQLNLNRILSKLVNANIAL